MIANGTVSILISGVGQSVVLAIITRVRESSLDCDSGSVSNVLQLSLSVGRDSISGLVTKQGYNKVG